jgi:hypothetical protein
MSDDLPRELGHPSDDDDRPVRDDLPDHLGKEPMDEQPVHHDPADHGIHHEDAGSTSGDVSTGGIVSPAPSGGSGDRGQDGTERETGPGPQSDWLRGASGSGDGGPGPAELEKPR